MIAATHFRPHPVEFLELHPETEPEAIHREQCLAVLAAIRRGCYDTPVIADFADLPLSVVERCLHELKLRRAKYAWWKHGPRTARHKKRSGQPTWSAQ